ncbi:hypothetical protein AC579_10202 [Pseudocercospora musae]|uniref:Uncharacterized protein n=1 Tax=Pseudocercospora musae TaxID=113226 RepID=A0A139I430_9PEZI|nr:hypothetical protein AC579_10202 [Pseudocercospora musae]
MVEPPLSISTDLQRPASGPPPMSQLHSPSAHGSIFLRPLGSANSFSPVASRASLPTTSSQEGLEGFARALLSRATSSNPSWSDILSRLYGVAITAAQQRRQRLFGFDPDSAERIETLQVLIDLCRKILTEGTSRTASVWSDLRVAAETAFAESISNEPP